MNDEHFEYIFKKIEKHLEPIKRSRPDVIHPRAKLAMVLEYVVFKIENVCIQYTHIAFC